MANTPTRIYRVTENGSGAVRLIRGTTKAGVRAFAARDAFTVEVASQDDLVNLVAQGKKVEETGGEQIDLLDAEPQAAAA